MLSEIDDLDAASDSPLNLTEILRILLGHLLCRASFRAINIAVSQ